METRIVSFSSQEAKEALLNEEVIAFPTETVYGLGAIATSETAFDNLVRIKRRPPEKPFTLMGGNNFDFDKYAILTPKIRRVIAEFVPGPLTLLLKPKTGLPHYITLDSPTIGIRIPGLKELRDFIDYVGVPLLVPSANKSGEKPALSANEAYKIFNGEIPYVIDFASSHQKPSTIIDFSKETPVLIRQGELTYDEVMKAYKGE